MKNTNVKRIAVFPVLMMLVVTALALIGSSFAWFTVANTASVSQITTSAQSDGVQLMLSQDAEVYRTRNLKINTSAAGTIIPSKLYQVSTNGKLADGATLLKFYNSQVEGYDIHDNLLIDSMEDKTVNATNGVLAAAPYAAGKTNYGDSDLTFGEAYDATHPTYIVFDLYMKVDRKANIYLYDGSKIAAQLSSTDDTEAEELLKSIRVAFVYLGSGTDAEHIQDETALTIGTKSVTVWEPAATEAGSPAAKVKTYGIIAESYQDDDHIADTEYHAYELVTDTTEEVTTYEDDELIVTDKDNTTGMHKLFSVEEENGCYSKVRIYVWLEGNDPDCTAAVASKFLAINLAFFAEEITA